MNIISRPEAIALGMNVYFTGVPCNKGHVSKRRVSGRVCIQCASEMQKSPAMLEKNRARNKEWYAKNRQEIRSERLLKRLENPEKERQRIAIYVRLNRDKVRESCLRYYYANWQAIREKQNASQKTRHLLRRAVEQNRRARKRKVGGIVSRRIGEFLLEKQKCRCANCRVSLKKTGYHMDHITPLALGGSNDDRNIQLLCPTCNLRKGAKDPIAWAQREGRLL